MLPGAAGLVRIALVDGSSDRFIVFTGDVL
jgi:hypothetical protein